MKFNLKSLIKKKKVTVTAVKVFTKEYLNTVTSIKKYLSTIQCPNCGQKNKLSLLSYEMGKYDWEGVIACTKCLSKGTINSTGIKFTLNINKLLVEER